MVAGCVVRTRTSRGDTEPKGVTPGTGDTKNGKRLSVWNENKPGLHYRVMIFLCILTHWNPPGNSVNYFHKSLQKKPASQRHHVPTFFVPTSYLLRTCRPAIVPPSYLSARYRHEQNTNKIWQNQEKRRSRSRRELYICLLPPCPKRTLANCLSCLKQKMLFHPVHHTIEYRMKSLSVVVSNNFNSVNIHF